MSNAQIFFTTYLIIGLLFALFSVRLMEKLSIKRIFISLIIALFAWPVLLNEIYFDKHK